MDEFFGAEICCGTYACINCLAEQGIRPLPERKEFEIASSVPFGLKYMERDDCDRMLTPLVDPNDGINKAAKIWGYKVECWTFKTGEEATLWLKTHLREGPLVLGPIDMGGLGYLPLSPAFRNIDHYVTVVSTSDERIDFLDSEYVGRIPCTWQVLPRLLQVGNVPESKGNIVVRRLKKEKEVPRHERFRLSLVGAIENLMRAKKSGQGPVAFRQCLKTIENVPSYIWKNSLLYEVSYVMQRKYLFLKMIEECYLEGFLNEKERNEIVRRLNCQIQSLGKLATCLKYGEIQAELFQKLEEKEREITDMMAERKSEKRKYI